MVSRYTGYPLWDWPVVWTSATEYATRVVEIPKLGLPNSGAAVTLFDIRSNIIDTVTYTNVAPWPVATGVSIELINAAADNSLPTNWRLSTVIGTPGYSNSAALDTVGDGMPDAWKQRIVDASGGLFTNISQVKPGDDFDGDGVPNLMEYIAGTDPTVKDADLLRLDITLTNQSAVVKFHTVPATGDVYRLYSGRFYTLESNTNILSADGWTNLVNYTDLPGTGGSPAYTNTGSSGTNFYQTEIRLQPVR
jgi:hypothetical protein